MLIRIVDVHFVYPGGVKALDGVTMTVAPGEKVALVGENGSGKTTLARHLNGLLSPAVGCVWVGDWQTSQVSPAQMAHRVAYVFQNPDEQLFRRWVWDEVAFGPQNLGFPAGRVRSAVDEALDLMGLGDVAQINPRDLGNSGRKRVAIAGALAMQTPVLVFDEPTAGMDAKDLGQLARAIDAVNRQGKTILMISHDIDFIAESMDRLALMSQGRVVLDAPANLFFEHNDRIEKAGLLAPQITRLSRRMGQPKLALNVDQFLDG